MIFRVICAFLVLTLAIIGGAADYPKRNITVVVAE